MSRIRLNSEYRNKGGVRFREHLEQENTQEKEAYFQARENIVPMQKDTWKLAEMIVRRHYTDEDVKMAYHLQNKFDNVSTIAKESCFHFGYKSNNKEDDDEHLNVLVVLILVNWILEQFSYLFNLNHRWAGGEYKWRIQNEDFQDSSSIN